MGKRKLRFSHPKNWERKKHSARHSVAPSQPSTTSQPPDTAQPATSHDQPPDTAQPTTSHDQPPITSPSPATPATSQPPAILPPSISSQSPVTFDNQWSTTSQPPATSLDQLPTTSPPPATPATSQPPAALPLPTSSQPPATSQPPTTLSQPLTTTIGELKTRLSCRNLGDWAVLSRDERLQICKFDHSNRLPSIVCCVEVQSNLEWTLYVRSVRIEASNVSSLSIIPTKVGTVTDVQNLLHAIDGCVICPANEYDTFAPLIDAHNGILKDLSGKLVLLLYKKSGVSNNSH